jgi:hypothetical protein
VSWSGAEAAWTLKETPDVAAPADLNARDAVDVILGTETSPTAVQVVPPSRARCCTLTFGDPEPTVRRSLKIGGPPGAPYGPDLQL